MQVRSIAKQTLQYMASPKIKQTVLMIVLLLLIPLLIAAALPVPDIIVKGKPWYDIRAYANWSTAVSSIGATEATVYVLRAETVSASSTPPATMDIQVLGGGSFAVSNGQVLDLSNCTLTAATRTIFSGAGSVVPPRNAAKLEWFGSLTTASSMLSTNPAILTIESNIAVTSTTSMPGTIGWDIQSNGRFTVTAGQTLTLAGSFSAPSGKQVFYGDGAVVPSTKQLLDSDWWPSFAKAVADIGTNTRELVVRSAETISGDLTVPTSGTALTLRIERGGTLNPAVATTTTLAVCPSAGAYNIFGGNGSSRLPANCAAEAEWTTTLGTTVALFNSLPGSVRLNYDQTLAAPTTITNGLEYSARPGAQLTPNGNLLTFAIGSSIIDNGGQLFNAVEGEVVLPSNFAYAHWFGATGSGADEGAKLNTAMRSLPQASFGPWRGGEVMLPAQFVCTTIQIEVPDAVRLRAANVLNGGIKAIAGFPTVGGTEAQSLVKLGKVVGTQYYSHGAQLEDLTVHCNDIAYNGVYSNSANENSGVRNVWLRYPTKYGLYFENMTVLATDPRLAHFYVQDVSVVYGSTVDVGTGAKGFVFTNTGSLMSRSAGGYVKGCTVSGWNQADAGFGNIDAGIEATGVHNLTIENFHAEFCDVGIRIGTGAKEGTGVSVTGYDGLNGVLTGIEINNTLTRNVVLTNINRVGGAGDLIVDNVSSNTLALQWVPFYISSQFMSYYYGGIWYHKLLNVTDRVDSGAYTGASVLLSVDTTNLNVANKSSIYVDTTTGNVNIYGFSGGVAGQRLAVLKRVTANNLVFQHDDVTGTQKLIMSGGADVTLTGNYGGAVFEYDGTHWFEINR